MRYQDHEWITSRIRMADVKCKCSDPACSGKHLDPTVRPRTVLMLKLAGVLLRDYDFKLTSVMRCEEHNKAVGGAKDSAHLHNCAVDVVSERWRDIALDAELQGVWSAIIVNPVKKQIHLDLHPSDRVTRGCVVAGRVLHRELLAPVRQSAHTGDGMEHRRVARAARIRQCPLPEGNHRRSVRHHICPWLNFLPLRDTEWP